MIMSNISLGQCGIFPSSQMLTEGFRNYMTLEDYFHLGDREVHPILFAHGNTVIVDTTLKKVTSEWYMTLLKVMSYITLIIPLIVAIFVLIKRCMTTVQTHANILLIVDPITCLQKLNEEKDSLGRLGLSTHRWEEAICDFNPHTKTPEQQTAFKACVDFLISHSLVQEEALFRKAVGQYKSAACVQLLLERGKVSSQLQKECLQEAVKCNHLDIALSLCNQTETARLFFDKLKSLDDTELRRQWTALFRLNPIETVEEMIEPFVQSFETSRHNSIRSLLKEVQHDCLQWLPHVSQHDKPQDLTYIQNAYQQKDDASLASVEKDRAYGKRCFELVNQLLTAYKQSQNLEPQGEKYRQLPTGANGKRTAAWFVEQIAIFRNQARQGDQVDLRNDPTTAFQTPLCDRYRWGHTLASEKLTQQNVCSSSYKGKSMTHFEWFRWHHGNVVPSVTWPDIEDLFQTVLTQNPNDKPNEFYKSLIGLVWLIGNTTPLNRGTGSVVESLWAFVHRYWNLDVPILKKEYPQFDVINISSILSTYQDIWRRYFSPSTLMPALQKDKC